MKSKYSGVIKTDQFLENQADLLEKQAQRLLDVARSLRTRAKILRDMEKEGRR